MIKKSSFGLGGAALEYERPGSDFPAMETIPVSENITLLIKSQGKLSDIQTLAISDSVKTGQRLFLRQGENDYAISPITGTVTSIAMVKDDFGRDFAQIEIKAAASEELDSEFAELSQTPSLEMAQAYLRHIPGAPPLDCFSNDETSIDTIVINGVPGDLFLMTSQFLTDTALGDIKKGIDILKKITGVSRFILVAPQNFVQSHGSIGAEMKVVQPVYPEGNPALIMKNVLNIEVAAGESFASAGVAFFTAEAVASIGAAFDSGRIPTEKTLTFIDKRGAKRLVQAKIGTPIGDIINKYGDEVNENDILIMGGPMTGSAVYSETFPVKPDTDGLMIRDEKEIHYYSDYSCINCGECVRACPANIPVNMLVRFLEAGKYQEASDSYDLMSCVECGLCSFVCVSQMPVFQYIRLAKCELLRMSDS